MNAPDNPASEPLERPAPAPAGRTNPNLTETLQADYEAVRNDLQQAQELAADFQRQVADKSNEVAHIKRLLEKTTSDLSRLEGHVAELRRERHRLANELMVASSTELELGKVKRERDQLRTELEELRSSTSDRIMGLQAELIEQRTEINRLEEEAKSTPVALPSSVQSGNEPAMQKIHELTATVARLMSMVEGRDQQSKHVHDEEHEEPSEDAFIDISFER